jgi:hypothetical protein
MAKQLTNLFRSKALKNLSKLAFLVRNVPSGKPASDQKMDLVRTSLELVTSIVLALIDGRKDDEGKKK